MPPECLAADQARRRRTPSRHNERLAMTPSEGQGAPSLTEPRNAGIRSGMDLIEIQSSGWEAGIKSGVERR